MVKDDRADSHVTPQYFLLQSSVLLPQDGKPTSSFKSEAAVFLTEEDSILAFKLFKRKVTNWKQST